MLKLTTYQIIEDGECVEPYYVMGLGDVLCDSRPVMADSDCQCRAISAGLSPNLVEVSSIA